jgi:SAM-dependent methyltransferase
MNTIEFIEKNIDIFRCPKCNDQLELDSQGLICIGCDRFFHIINNIPRLFVPNEWDSSKEDVTEKIKAFYEKNPFPDYDNFDNTWSLIEKSRTGIFARLLDDQIPFGTRILECGCGTGQLTNFLSIANRTVIGTDICLNSLEMGQRFKEINQLKNAVFFQMNLFRPCFKRESFDLVIANGVLHHTSDPFLGFKSISTLVRPNRYILLGLYHRYGRIFTDIRRLLFSFFKGRFKFLDRRLVNEAISESKRHSWFMDQYNNPHESKHTLKEVLHWFDKTGFSFIKCIPKPVLFSGFSDSEQLFERDKLGNRFERAVVNLNMVFRGITEEGFFVVIAKKFKS